MDFKLSIHKILPESSLFRGVFSRFWTFGILQNTFLYYITKRTNFSYGKRIVSRIQEFRFQGKVPHIVDTRSFRVTEGEKEIGRERERDRERERERDRDREIERETEREVWDPKADNPM
jgi:hypothetical protein